MTPSELADKIINNPNGYTKESVEVAKWAKELRERCLELLVADLAIENIGIYPQRVNGKDRTEKQDGWNDCAMSVAKDTNKISHYIETLPEQIIDHIIKEKIRIHASDEVSMYVLCNDLFFWACADMEDFELSDLDDFNQSLKESPENGDLLWCCRKRKMRPQQPYYKYFSEEEKKSHLVIIKLKRYKLFLIKSFLVQEVLIINF